MVELLFEYWEFVLAAATLMVAGVVTLIDRYTRRYWK